MPRVLLLSLTIIVAGCVTTKQIDSHYVSPQLSWVKKNLIGTWVGIGDGTACTDNDIVFQNDGTKITYSGNLEIKYQYELEEYKSGVLVTQKLISVDGESSCSGTSASSYKRDHYRGNTYLEMHPSGILIHYYSTGRKRMSSRMVLRKINPEIKIY